MTKKNDKIRLLITSFEPFTAGRKVNNSNFISKELKACFSQYSFLEVETAELPVVYDLGALVGMLAIDFFEPDMVLSLGEGKCEVRLEKFAYNLDDSSNLADNWGEMRVNQPISTENSTETVVPSGACLGIPFDALMERLQDHEKKGMVVSHEMGNFVCNNTAFHLNSFCENKKIAYGFIHVPPIEGCLPEVSDAKMIAKKIFKLFERCFQ